MTTLTDLDPFTTIWRAPHKRRSSRQRGQPDRFHLDPTCPVGGSGLLKGRLGSVLTHGWELCSYEGEPDTWNRTLEVREEGRRRAVAAIARGSPLGTNAPLRALGVDQ